MSNKCPYGKNIKLMIIIAINNPNLLRITMSIYIILI